MILIRKKVDFFGVFQSLQAIYNQFSDWESRLLALFTEAASVQEVLECAYPIFRGQSISWTKPFTTLPARPPWDKPQACRGAGSPWNWTIF